MAQHETLYSRRSKFSFCTKSHPNRVSTTPSPPAALTYHDSHNSNTLTPAWGYLAPNALLAFAPQHSHNQLRTNTIRRRAKQIAVGGIVNGEIGSSPTPNEI